MGRQIPALFGFNRGIASVLALARQDQKRLAFSAETMDNFISRVLGPMSFRPGWGYVGATKANLAARFLKFIFSTADTSLIELTNLVMRVWINDTLLTRVAVSTTVTNGTFAGNITGWTDGSDAGGVAAYEAANYLKLTSNGTARAIAYQQVTVAGGDQNKEHALRIVIERDPVTLRIGSTLGDDDYVGETNLSAGQHSIAFTPAGNFFIQFSATTIFKNRISSCTIEGAGVVEIATPWVSADLGNVRYDQSADVLFIACDGYQQRKIERRGTHPGARSWSVCVYQSDDGPFTVQNVGPITLTGAATTGDTTITASHPLFRPSHVGALFSLTSTGQTQTKTIAAQNTFTNGIRVTGVGESRSFGITITGSLAGVTKITLQNSLDNFTWNDVAGQSWTAVTSTAYADGLNNQYIYYRLGIKTGDYAGTDSATCTLVFNAGVQRGIVRITGYTNNTTVSAQVLQALGGTSATAIWQEGQWSGHKGYPTSVRLHEGRLWWFGRNGIVGSISDAFSSFDETVTGASAPINRTIGSGPVDVINFALSLQRLILGAEGKEISVRSSALDTPLTAIDFNMKDASTQGSAKVEAWKVDQKGIYVQRGGIKVYELNFDMQTFDYNSTDLTQMCPELGLPGIVRLDVQRQPDTRFHAVRSDGVVMIATYDKAEDVLAWQTVSTTGFVEDVIILPSPAGSTEDQVYYVINRTVAGAAVRYLEKWAKETECRGATVSRNMDSFITFGAVGATIIGLTHLVGMSVVVWQDGAPALDANGAIKLFTVSNTGTVTLDTAVTVGGAVGLPYTGQWKSAKLGMQTSAAATLLNQQKKLSHLGLVLAYFAPKALQFGPDFTHLDDMPGIERGTTVSGTQASYDEQEFPFPGTWVTDLRLCLQAASPRPVTVLAVACDLEVHN